MTGLYSILCGVHTLGDWHSAFVKGALYRIWCGVNRLGDSAVKVV